MVAQHTSMASALLTALNPVPYGRYINYISEEEGITVREFEDSILSKQYTLDLQYNYHGNGHQNKSALYTIFGLYSDDNADTVQLNLLNEVTHCVNNFKFYESTGFVCLHMKKLSLDEWLSKQQHKTTKGDQITVYILSRLYNQHTMIHTKKKPWFTILPTGLNFNYAAACQTHLLYMGNHVYGLLLPKPLPLAQAPLPSSSAVSITTPTSPAPIQQQVSMMDAALPTGTTTSTEAENTTGGNMSEDTTNRDPNMTGKNDLITTLQNTENTAPEMSEAPSIVHISAKHPDDDIVGTNIAAAVTGSEIEPSPNLEPNVSLVVSSVDEPTPQTPDDTSNDRSVVNLDKTTANVVTQFSGILTKECRVVLISLDASAIAKAIPSTSKIKNVTEDTSNTDSGKDTLSDQSSTGSDETSLSQLFNWDQGRPRRRTKKVKYEESSPSSDSDSSFEKTPKKRFKPHPRMGPSADRLPAYKHSHGIANVPTTEPVHSTSTAPSNESAVQQNKSAKIENQNDVPLTSDMTSQNRQTNQDNTTVSPNDVLSVPSNDKPAPPGRLSVTHHGLHKPKKYHRFKYKECEFIATSCKEANDHLKNKHNKRYCNVCGKACNTPSTLAQHVYSHREELPFPCGDCELKFAFEGQLKQHRFKHRTLSAFPCSKCDKTYKREGELIKHLKVHENKTYSCTECKYSTKDPRNLKQHAKLHIY